METVNYSKDFPNGVPPSQMHNIHGEPVIVPEDYNRVLQERMREFANKQKLKEQQKERTKAKQNEEYEHLIERLRNPKKKWKTHTLEESIKEKKKQMKKNNHRNNKAYQELMKQLAKPKKWKKRNDQLHKDKKQRQAEEKQKRLNALNEKILNRNKKYLRDNQNDDDNVEMTHHRIPTAPRTPPAGSRRSKSSIGFRKRYQHNYQQQQEEEEEKEEANVEKVNNEAKSFIKRFKTKSLEERLKEEEAIKRKRFEKQKALKKEFQLNVPHSNQHEFSKPQRRRPKRSRLASRQSHRKIMMAYGDAQHLPSINHQRSHHAQHAKVDVNRHKQAQLVHAYRHQTSKRGKPLLSSFKHPANPYHVLYETSKYDMPTQESEYAIVRQEDASPKKDELLIQAKEARKSPPTRRPSKFDKPMSWNLMKFHDADVQYERVPYGRHSHACVTNAYDTMMIFGGTLDDDVGSDASVYRYAAIPETWDHDLPGKDKEGIEPPQQLTGHSMIYKEDENALIVFGGIQEGGKMTNAIYTYSLHSYNWSQVNVEGNKPSPCYLHSATYCPYFNTMVVVGGRHATHHTLSRVHLFDFTQNMWFRVSYKGTDSSQTPQTRFGHASVLYALMNVIVFGGQDEENVFNDLWNFNCRNQKWSRLVPYGVPLPKSASPTMCIHGHTLFLYLSEQLFAVDVNHMRCSIVNIQNPIPPRLSPSLVYLHGSLLLFGGLNLETNICSQELYRLEYDSTVSSQSSPTRRHLPRSPTRTMMNPDDSDNDYQTSSSESDAGVSAILPEPSVLVGYSPPRHMDLSNVQQHERSFSRVTSPKRFSSPGRVMMSPSESFFHQRSQPTVPLSTYTSQHQERRYIKSMIPQTSVVSQQKNIRRISEKANDPSTSTLLHASHSPPEDDIPDDKPYRPTWHEHESATISRKAFYS